MILPMKLRDWVIQDKLDWEQLSANPAAIELQKASPNKINWMWWPCDRNFIFDSQADSTSHCSHEYYITMDKQCAKWF